MVNLKKRIWFLKQFGKGQITLPKAWRVKDETVNYVAEETPYGLLIKPFVEATYYELNENNFGLNFPTGMDAKELVAKLRKANERLS